MGALGAAEDSDRDDWGGLELSYHTVSPNRWTFQSKKIRRWVEERLRGRTLNACAGKTKLAHDHEIVPVEDPPKRMLGNLLIDGPDGQCAYIYSGIEQRCQETADAHTHIEHGGEWVRVEMCAEHAREDVPEFDEWKQEVLR